MIIERISRIDASKVTKVGNFAMHQLEGQWDTNEELLTLEFLKGAFDRQRETVMSVNPNEEANELKWDSVLKNLEDGKIVADMFNLYRVKNDLPKCPVCGASYIPGQEALSRKDNNTAICSDCGVRESFANYK